MKLTDLEPKFLTIEDEKTVRTHDIFEDAQGIAFLCPKCFIENGGSIGTHQVWCWFRHKDVPDEYNPKPGRWTPQGSSYDDLTFIPGDPPMACSVLLTSGCGWHGFVTNGEVT